MSNPPALQSFSQHGEDLLIWEFFGRKNDGFFIEVGANHPTELSQTWFFEQRGWRGMLVEPLPACCEKLRAVRKNSIICPVAVGGPEHVGEADLQVAEADAWSRMGELDTGAKRAGTVRVPVQTLETLCQENKAPHIDLLSIDVEGMEIPTLRGFDLRGRRPTLIILEDHLVEIDLALFMWRSGYQLVKRTGCNNWWMPKDARRVPAQTFKEKVKLWNRVLFRNPHKKLWRWLTGPRLSA